MTRMRHILTYQTQKLVVLIDDTEYPALVKHSWHWNGRYVATRIGGKTTYMHRLIMRAGPRQEVDHINGDGLDNRLVNLRLCNRFEQNRNSRKLKTKTSKYKGVCWHPGRKSTHTGFWRATIMVNRKQICLGTFSNEIEAARAYNEAALRYFGAFACVNHL